MSDPVGRPPPGEGPSPRLTTLFASFARTGGVLFGGGYAMLPLLEREIADRRRWLTHAAMTDLFALAQVIPGVIAVNVALLTGQRLRGWRGAVAAVLGIIAAPFLIMLLLAGIYDVLLGHAWMIRFVGGLRSAVAGLLMGTAIRLVLRNGRRAGLWAISAGVAGITLLLDLNPVWPILAAVAAGLAGQRLRAGRPRREVAR
jgi:chromate transporter